MQNNKRVWVVSELYHPERTSTGHVLTVIAEGLADEFDVRAVCAQPTYSARGIRAPKSERRHGVAIHRVPSTNYGPLRPALKLVDLVTISLSTLARLLRSTRRGDILVAVTNPPTLPFVATVVARLRGATVVVIVHDLFPDVLAVLAPPGPLKRLLLTPLRALTKRLFQSADHIVVLGADQRDRVLNRYAPGRESDISIIPISYDDGMDEHVNRNDSEFLRSSLPVEAQQHTIFQIAGNLGPLQGIERLVETIAQQRVPDAHFCFVGNGRSRQALETVVRDQQLQNVSVLDPVPREKAADLHAACDVIIIPLIAGMSGVSVPSRISNALAAGKPIIAVSEPNSTLDRLIVEHGVGWSLHFDDDDQFWAAVDAARDPHRRQQRGAAAHNLAKSNYTKEGMVTAFKGVIHQLH